MSKQRHQPILVPPVAPGDYTVTYTTQQSSSEDTTVYGVWLGIMLHVPEGTARPHLSYAGGELVGTYTYTGRVTLSEMGRLQLSLLHATESSPVFDWWMVRSCAEEILSNYTAALPAFQR